jgi:ABC-2 type transport system permease protein
MIRTGEMDVILIRPLGSLFQLVSADFQLRRVGKLLQAVVVLAYALGGLHVAWTVVDVGFLLVMLAAGTTIFTSVWICGVALSFWTTETTELNNAFTYGGAFLSSYPLEIYGVWVRRLLAIGIPMAFVNYYPSLYLLDRDDPFGSPTLLRFVSPAVALATAAIAGAFWRLAVRHYRSTGS